MKLIIKKDSEQNQIFDFVPGNVYAIFTNEHRLDKEIIKNNSGLITECQNYDHSIFNLRRLGKKKELGRFLEYYGLDDIQDIIAILRNNLLSRFDEDGIFNYHNKKNEIILDVNTESNVEYLPSFLKMILLIYIKLYRESPIFFLTSGLTYRNSLLAYKILYSEVKSKNKIAIVIENRDIEQISNEIVKVDKNFISRMSLSYDG